MTMLEEVYWEGSGLEQGPQGNVCGTELAGVQVELVQHSPTYSLIFGWSCEEPGVGFGDPYRSLPAQNISWFYGSRIVSILI